MPSSKNWTLEQARDANRKSRSYSLDIPKIRELTASQKRRRAKCRNSAAEFIKTYCTACDGGFLKVPPTKKMEAIIAEMQKTVMGGERYQIMMPRAHGKSSYVKGVVAWSIAFGHKHFVEIVAANGKMASRMLGDVWRLFCRSPKLMEDFPEICDPIAKLEGKSNRCQSVTVDKEATNMKKTAEELNFPTVKDSPSSGAIVISVGFKAASRGAVFGSMRPDLIIFDDIQDRALAENETLVEEAMNLIHADFLGGGSHLDAVSAFMTATPIAAGDLTERIINSGSWRTAKFKMMPSMPRIYGASDGDLWSEYAQLRAKESNIEGGNPAKACRDFYLAHRDAMDEGAEILNDTNYDHKREVSAIQHAMNLLFDNGKDAFDAEYQMEPRKTSLAFEVTPRMILSRVRTGVEAKWTPPGTVMTVAATDINPSYAISTAVVRFDVSLTAFVTAYFVQRCKLDDSANDTAYHQRIFNLITQHGRAIKGLGISLDAWGVDAGGKQFDPVTRFSLDSRALVGIQCTAMTGRAGRNWNPNVRSRIRNAANETVFCRDERGRVWLAWNADHYKVAAQKAWATETGAPGGCSLFDGGVNHVDFAQQIANEKLVACREALDGRIECLWKTKEPHDFGDCMAMSYALAGARNLSASSSLPSPSKPPPQTIVTMEDISVGCDF